MSSAGPKSIQSTQSLTAVTCFDRVKFTNDHSGAGRNQPHRKVHSSSSLLSRKRKKRNSGNMNAKKTFYETFKEVYEEDCEIAKKALKRALKKQGLSEKNLPCKMEDAAHYISVFSIYITVNFALFGSTLTIYVVMKVCMFIYKFVVEHSSYMKIMKLAC